jgi:copper homeostasis protein CutC
LVRWRLAAAERKSNVSAVPECTGVSKVNDKTLLLTLRGANVSRIVAGTGVREVHLSARVSVESRMTHRNSRCYMGGMLRPPEFSWKATDESVVRDVVERLRQGGQTWPCPRHLPSNTMTGD